MSAEPSSAEASASSASQQRATFRACFAVAEFRVLFGSQVLLVLGDTVKMLAFSVLVYARSGSPGLSALAYMIGFLPQLAGGMLLLSLADRWRPRRLIIAGDLIRFATCVVLGLDSVPIAGLLALAFLTGLPVPLFTAARSAVLPEVLRGDAYILGRALFTATAAAGQIAGLALGGGLLAVTGPARALLITAVLSLVSALIVRLGLRDRPARAVPGGGTVRTTLRINRVLLADRPVRGLLLASWLPLMLSIGAEALYVPYLTELGSASAAGVVLAAAAAGMGLGNFVVGRFAPPGLRERLSFPLACAMGVPLLGFAVRPGVAAAAALAALSAAGLAYNLGLQRRFLDAVPEYARGQAFGLQTSGVMTAQALGAAAVGALAELVPSHAAIALAGCGAIAAAFALRADLKPPSES